MALADHYLLIKAAHVGLAMLSGGLFAGRGVGVLLGAEMPMLTPVRRLSQVIDTALLAAALLLLATLLRLSLNIATTRLILSEGYQGFDAAGHVIAGFASFVIGGDFVIGTIVGNTPLDGGQGVSLASVRAIVRAASQASKAADWLLGFLPDAVIGMTDDEREAA